MSNFLKGPFAVLITPFKDNKIDDEVFIKQLERINDSDIKGFVVNGSTAEFVSMSIEEQKHAIDLVMKTKVKDKKVVISACASNVVDVIDIAKYGKKVGADGILVCSPYYFTWKKDERKKFFLTVADNSPIPVILYNIPFFTQEIEVDLASELLCHKNVIGIKDSSANMKRIMHLIDLVKGKDKSVLTGTDDILISALFGGCCGSFTAFASIYPKEVSKLYSACESGDYDTARKIQESFMPLLRKADSESFPLGYKRLLGEVLGVKVGDKEI